MQTFDVLVIGGGIAGTAAALAASGRGRRTALVTASPGVTAMAAGGWRGPLPETLADRLARAGLPHQPVDLPLPHPTGSLERFDHAPASHAAAPPRAGALVCGITGLPGFRASALARLWGDAAGRELTAARVEAGPDTPPAGWSPAGLAARLEREPGPLAEAVARAVHTHDAAAVIMPAVLGLERHAAVRAALESAAGVPVGEALGVPPASVPGWRLDRALRRLLDDADVEVLDGRVTDRRAADGALRSVETEDGRTLATDAFVLATGKYAARGIVAGERFRETALDCPVWIEDAEGTIERNEPDRLTRDDATLAQPLLRAGVHTDDAGRPVDPWGGVVYDNVFAAGTVVAGREAAAPGLGDAAADGDAAGRRAAS